MVKSFVLCLLGFLLIVTVSVRAQQNHLTFEQKNWDISSANAEVVQYMGRETLLIRSGTALLEDVEFQDGMLEVYIAPTSSFAFAGLVFRAESADNLEEVYLRLNKSGLPDAVQYTPRYNGIAGWQLYNGEGFTAPAVFPHQEWIHLKLIVEGSECRVFVGNIEEPVLTAQLQRKATTGKIGLWGLFGAYISNFRYTKTTSVASLSESNSKTDVPENYLTDWELSQVFPADSIDLEKYPDQKLLRSITWGTIKSDGTGLINISKLRYASDADGGDASVYARTTIASDKDQVRKLSFGYSDEVSVFLNGKLLFGGNSRWRSRDLLFNGIVGLNDHLYLDLKEGKNELLFIVTEWFGGWGIMARIDQ